MSLKFETRSSSLRNCEMANKGVPSRALSASMVTFHTITSYESRLACQHLF